MHIFIAKENEMSDTHPHDFDEADDNIIEHVNTVGWSVAMIEATDYLPSFAYTIGLWKSYGHPELISFGLTVKTLHEILNLAGENIKNGAQYKVGTVYSEFFTNGNAQLLAVDERNIRDYFGYAVWFNKGQEFPAMQLVWTDRDGKYPWEEGYGEEFKYRQPLLDRNADFKFKEEKNVAVFTTRQWIEEHKPILQVVHDEDGDWQFLTGDQYLEDMIVVTLAHLVIKDPSLNDVFNLEYGEQAVRDSAGGNWKRSKAVFEE